MAAGTGTAVSQASSVCVCVCLSVKYFIVVNIHGVDKSSYTVVSTLL